MTMDKSKMPLPGAPTLPSLDRPLSSLPIVQDAVRRVTNSLPNHLWPGSGFGGDRSLTPAPTPNITSHTDVTNQSQTHQRAGIATSMSNLPLSNHFHKQARKMQVMKTSVARHKAFAQRVASTLLEESQPSSSVPPAMVVRDPSPLRQHVERRPVSLHRQNPYVELGTRSRHAKTSVHDSKLWLPSQTHAPEPYVDPMRMEEATTPSLLFSGSTSDSPLTTGNGAHASPGVWGFLPLNFQDLLKSESIKIVQARVLPKANWRPDSIAASTRLFTKESLSTTKE